MQLFRKQAALAIAIATCYSLLTSCAESRVTQCSKLMAIVNQGNALVDSKKDSPDSATTQALAQQLKLTAKQLETLNLTDKNLQTFQRQLITTFRKLSQALSNLGQAFSDSQKASTSKQGREEMEQAKREARQAGFVANQVAQTQDAVTDKLRNYCNTGQL